LTAQRASKARAFVPIILLLIVIIVALALLSVWPARIRYAPIVQEAFWDVDGQRVTTAKVGVEVKAHVRIKATEEYVGLVVVRIRKDIALWPDSDYQVLSVPVNLVGDQEKEIELTFAPDKTSGGRLRGYFIEIDFETVKTKWVMENSYPPRLTVV